jgi:hypothetical protein
MLFEERAELPGGHRNEGVSRLCDGLLHGDQDTWVVVAHEGVDIADWLGPHPGEPAGATLRVCRAVLDDGTLVLGGMHAGAVEHPFAALLDFE